MYRYLYRSSWQYCKNCAAASDLLLIGKVLAYAAAAADWIKVYTDVSCDSMKADMPSEDAVAAACASFVEA
jgi:hypothetical protein